MHFGAVTEVCHSAKNFRLNSSCRVRAFSISGLYSTSVRMGSSSGSVMKYR
jgi:hypothetical protein